MQERIGRVLDGELPESALTREERLELDRQRAAIGRTLAAFESIPDIDVTAAVLRRVAQLETAPASQVWPGRALAAALRWLWRPAQLTLRPAFGVAALAVLLAGAALLRPSGAPTVPLASVEPVRVLVQFRLGASDAQDVRLVGDFTGWQPDYRLHEQAPGVWSVVVALEPGVYDYAFVLDGEQWRLDPLAPQVSDGFGGANSRVAVMPPERAL